MSFEQKMEINLDLRTKILSFLCVHTFSTFHILSQLIQRDYAQLHRLINKLHDEGLVSLNDNPEGAKNAKKIVGITVGGVNYCLQNQIINEKCSHFIPSKAGALSNLNHKFTIQQYIINLQNQFRENDYNRTDFYSLPKQNQQKPVPDLIFHLNAIGKADFHVEIELTQKSHNRYKSLLISFLNNDMHILYLFPNQSILNNVSKILANNIPCKWPKSKLLLAAPLYPSLAYEQHIWLHDNNVLKTHQGINQLYARDVQLLKSDNDSSTYLFDFHPFPIYEDQFDIEIPIELIGKLDEKGRVIPKRIFFR